jgi:ATP phosphoribosyltransferase
MNGLLLHHLPSAPSPPCGDQIMYVSTRNNNSVYNYSFTKNKSLLKTLKIAIQKSGRLNEKSVELLKNCGLNFENYKSSLISPVSNFPLEILFLRDDDIPEYVQDGIADLGIVGENVIQETEVVVSYLQKLGFGKCSLKWRSPTIRILTLI